MSLRSRGSRAPRASGGSRAGARRVFCLSLTTSSTSRSHLLVVLMVDPASGEQLNGTN